jgi:diguanylate cyclase (GGDEF)-like protein
MMMHGMSELSIDAEAAPAGERDVAGLLLDVARRLGDSVSVHGVSTVIADAAPEVVGSDRSAVVLWDEAGEQFFMSATSRWPGELVDNLNAWVGTPDDSPDLKRIMQSGRPALLHEGSRSAWVDSVLNDFKITAFAVTPIMVNGRFMGLIAVHWAGSPAPRTLGTSCADRLTGLASMAGIALNGQLLLEDNEWRVGHDELTGLLNRNAFRRHAIDVLQDEPTAPVTVLACVIDRFGRVATVFAQDAIDSILREVSDRLRASVGDRAIIAHYSGDGFLIMLPNTAQNAGDGVISRIKTQMALPFAVGNRDIHLDLLIGRAVSEGDGAADPLIVAQTLVTEAEADLRVRKNARPPVHINPPVDDELQLDADLRLAANSGEIVAAYQPQIDLASGRTVGVEALTRWNHPKHGAISPAQFIPLAEANGTIVQIGRAMLAHACRDAAAWLRSGHRLVTSVNVSAVQLELDDCVPYVRALLEEFSLPAELLTIEITESGAVRDLSDAQDQLRALRNLGVGISIDDFGTGFSSLTQLNMLPVTELKIDMSFVQGIDGGGHHIVAGVVGFARGLELEVVAEGVETDRQREVLRELGCDRGQGYLWSRPTDFQGVCVFLGDEL